MLKTSLIETLASLYAPEKDKSYYRWRQSSQGLKHDCYHEKSSVGPSVHYELNEKFKLEIKISLTVKRFIVFETPNTLLVQK